MWTRKLTDLKHSARACAPTFEVLGVDDANASRDSGKRIIGSLRGARSAPVLRECLILLLDDEADEAQADVIAPELSERQQQEAEDRTSVSALVVHEAIRYDGEEELVRPVVALFWSGLAAGMSMGFSLVAMALFKAYMPEASWTPLLVRLGYPLGFLIVIIGRQQLFTENTLTAIIPLLARRNMRTLLLVARLWAVVLVANMIGAHLFAWVAGDTPMFGREVQHAMLVLATRALNVSFGEAVLRGIFAGWLIAMVVWMLAATDSGRVAIIVILTYIVGLANLTHIIAGAVEVLFPVMVGTVSWWHVAWGYLIPTLIGNSIGGVSLTAAINHAQVVSGMATKKHNQADRSALKKRNASLTS